MKARVQSKIIFILILIFCLIVSAGCSRQDVTEITPESRKVSQEPESIIPEEAPLETDDVEPESQPLHEMMEGMKEVYVYSFESDSFEVIDVVKIVPEEHELSARFIVDLVLEEFSANSLEVGVLDVTEEDNSVIVNFDGSLPPVTEVGAELETTILDCISHSLLDNVEGCQKVYLRIDGQRYESGHILYELDEAYE